MVKTVADWGKHGRRNRMSGWCILAAAATGWAAVCGPAAGQCNYEVVEPVIQGPNCPFVGPRPTNPLGMNNLGEAVGYHWHCSTSTIWHAFVWRPGEGLTTLPTPDGADSAFASDINDAGFIAGGHRFPGVGWKGFIRHPVTGEYTYLDALHDDLGALNTVSTANAINNAAAPAVAGSRVISQPGEPVIMNAIIWLPYGEDGEGPGFVIDLGDMDFGPNSAANDVNDDLSSTVGWTGTGTFSTSQFPFEVDGDLHYKIANGTFGINFGSASHTTNIGRVVGGANFAQGNRAFIWEKDKLAVIDPLPGHESSFSAGANDLGQVLVVSRTGPAFVPGIWQNGILTDVTEGLIAPPDLIVGRGRALNAASEVLASAKQNGKDVGALLVPIDRPMTDLNGDCITNVIDLLILLNEWGPCGYGSCPADFTGDGNIGVADLLLMLANWDGR